MLCSGIWRYVPSGPNSRVGSLLGSHPRYRTEYASKNIFVVLCTIIGADLSGSADGQGQCPGPGVAGLSASVSTSCYRILRPGRRLRRERGEGKGDSTPGTGLTAS